MRLFLALDLPEGVRAAVDGWRETTLGRLDGLRPVPERALHVTLTFLGSTPADQIERVWAAASTAAAGRGAPLLGAVGVTAVPLRRPRLFALDLADDAGRAGTLSASVAGALVEAGLHEPEERPFWPHVTFARVRQGAKVALPAVVPPPALGPFTARIVTLYRSDPSHSGASYTALERLELRAR